MCAGWTTNRSLGGGISVRTAWLLGAQLWGRGAVPDIRLYDWRDVAWQRSCRKFSGVDDDAVHGADGFSYQSLCRGRSLRYQIGGARADTRRGLTSLGHDARLMPGSSCSIPRRPQRPRRPPIDVRVFNEVLGLSHSGARTGRPKARLPGQDSPLSTPEILS